MTDEEKLLRDNSQLIRYCVHQFITERNMPYRVYYDDVFQEAVIGFLNYSRKVEAGRAKPNCASSAIRYHLYNAFISQHGIKRTRYCKREIKVDPVGEVALLDREIQDPIDRIVYAADIDRWISTLSPDDQLVVRMILWGYPPKEIAEQTKKKSRQYRYQKSRLKKLYSDYFGEAG